jgi:hypothetical protein
MLKWLQRLTPVAAIFLTGFGRVCIPPASFQLNLPSYGLTKPYPQTQPYWCWAASGALVMNVVHPSSKVQQWDEAQQLPQNAGKNCKVDQSSCNSPGYPNFNHYGFQAKQSSITGHYLSSADIKNQLACQRKSFAFIWKRVTSGGSHMMAAIGYSFNQTGQFLVLVNNPLPVNQGDVSYVSYQDYTGSSPYSDHTLSDNYYNVTYVRPY